MILILILFLIAVKPVGAIDQTILPAIKNRLIDEFKTLPCVPTMNANLTINNPAASFPISIGTLGKMAGAIGSLKIDGKETVNIRDHGREVQYAFQVNGAVEENNPTEAGNLFDTNSSSSVFLGGCTNNNTLYTKSQMAYWHALNGKKTSNYILEKIVTIGSYDMPNVIRFAVKIHMPEAARVLNFELPTGYHTEAYGQLSIYDSVWNTIRPSNDSEISKNLFGIFDRAYNQKPNMIVLGNGSYSMAPYSPIKTDPYFYGYSSISEKTNKWQISDRANNINPGDDFYYESFLVINTPGMIVSDLNKLLNLAPPANSVPTGNVDAISELGIVNGWAADRNNASVSLQFYLDSPSGTLIGNAMASEPRQDVLRTIGYGLSSGFHYQIPITYLTDGKQHSIYVYAVDSNPNNVPGTNTLLNPNGFIVPPYSPPPSRKLGDANDDQKVTMADFLIWRKEFLTGVGLKSDFNNDSKVTFADFGIWRREFLRGMIN